MASNQNRNLSDDARIQKKSPISSNAAYDVGDTTVVISMSPFIGSRTPTNFTSLSKRKGVSSKTAKLSSSAPTVSHSKSTRASSKSTLTNVESTSSVTNITLVGKQSAKLDMRLKGNNKAKSFKSVSIESPRLLPSSRDLYLRSSNMSTDRGNYDLGVESKTSAHLARIKPRISLKSSNSIESKISKLETPRWIQGVLVKDMGTYNFHNDKDPKLQNYLMLLISHFLLNHANLKISKTLEKEMKLTFSHSWKAQI